MNPDEMELAERCHTDICPHVQAAEHESAVCRMALGRLIDPIEKMLKTSQFTTDPATYLRRIERLRDEYVRASDDLAMAYHERRNRGR